MSDHPICIELSNVNFKWPGSSESLFTINQLAIRHGENIFIQGASGSGKSTLLNLLTGALSPCSGEITILEHGLNTLSQAQRDQFRADHYGVIFQQFNLIPYLNVIENVTLPLSFSAYKLKRAELLNENIINQAVKLLDKLGIENSLAKQNVTQLSTGQQQRVAAARCLIGTPEIIIADEPTSALDQDTKHQFIKLLFNEAKKFNSTVVFVSHDHSLSSLFDRVINISDFKPTI